MAWDRTALAFGALGGIVVRRELWPGLVILAMVPVVWQLGKLTGPSRPRLMTAAIVAVSAVALVVALLTAAGVTGSPAGRILG